jgi:hypothetical protein
VPEERYEDFLGPLPQYAPDPRQADFLGAVKPSGGPKKILVDQRLGKVEIANVGRGWPATWPNLGFLKTGTEHLIATEKLDPASKKQIHQFLNWAVQRVIRVSISLDPGVTHVRFWTKDDYGTYGFEFSVGYKSARGLESEPGTGAKATTGG